MFRPPHHTPSVASTRQITDSFLFFESLFDPCSLESLFRPELESESEPESELMPELLSWSLLRKDCSELKTGSKLMQWTSGK